MSDNNAKEFLAQIGVSLEDRVGAYNVGRVAGYAADNLGLTVVSATLLAIPVVGWAALAAILLTKVNDFRVIYRSFENGELAIGPSYEEKFAGGVEPTSFDKALIEGFKVGRAESTVGIAMKSESVRSTVENVGAQVSDTLNRGGAQLLARLRAFKNDNLK